MSVELNHTIVHARDKGVSAAFLARILDLPVGASWGPFLPLRLTNGVTLDYVDVGENEIQPQHYAFLISDEHFDSAFARIREAEIAYYADPFHEQPNEINHDFGGRGVYFVDPDGHNLELMTVPYGDAPAH
ncbi:VOC family protein [Nonomuraea mesophila]|uniref:VOC family protein n=1 Tax=Nonomuraea mesophila TaxID=2530382 RepID=A0A4R5FNT0_9ACTN|nr:VOC family protein [Nonomuraea mesophila]TDE54640.1 VOC family protein [Nonomuraea mesophila]